MFTGLIETTAEVLDRTDGGITVARPRIFDDVTIGSSVAVSGACLTIVELTDASMRFDVVPETWARTTLGKKQKGDRVNLERALRADGRFEGHVVQGHVEGVGVIVSVSSSIPRPLPPEEEGESWEKSGMGANLLHFSREMRKKPMKAVEFLWEHLRHDQLGVRFRRQYVIGGRILDFFCPRENLAIELDGAVHTSRTARKEDALRDEYLKEDHRVRVLRFTNDQVLNDVQSVLSILRSVIGSPPPPEEGAGVEVTIELPSDLARFVVPKGSIALDGVSLTVATVENDDVTVALVPHTLKETTLGLLREGDRVNVETDVLVRAVLLRGKTGM